MIRLSSFYPIVAAVTSGNQILRCNEEGLIRLKSMERATENISETMWQRRRQAVVVNASQPDASLVESPGEGEVLGAMTG